MTLFACSRCGKTSDQKQCPKHRRPKSASWSTNRNRSKQHAFRQQVLANAGHRCQYVEGTARCPVHGDQNLRACHITPLHQGGSYHPDNGKALCQAHDRLTDPWAR
jgi:predicted restriction endonuclease